MKRIFHFLRTPLHVYRSIAALTGGLIATGVLATAASSTTPPPILDAPPAEIAVPVDDPECIAELTALAKHSADITNLSAHFSQTRESAALRRAVTSTGTLRLHGNASHWKTQEPYQYDMWVRRSEVVYYYPADKLVEIYDLSDVAPDLVFGPKLDIERLRKGFIISRSALASPGSLVVRLTPRTASGVFQPMDITIDRRTGHVHSVLTVDEHANRTTLVFENIKTNPGVTSQDVEPAWPDDVDIQRIRVDGRAIDHSPDQTDAPSSGP